MLTVPLPCNLLQVKLDHMVKPLHRMLVDGDAAEVKCNLHKLMEGMVHFFGKVLLSLHKDGYQGFCFTAGEGSDGSVYFLQDKDFQLPEGAVDEVGECSSEALLACR